MTDRRALDDTALSGLGERLRELRQARGWSLGQLSTASGVPPSTISKIENLLMAPSLVHAINLASALGENLGFLMDRSDARAADLALVGRDARKRIDLPEMDLTLFDVHGDFEPGVLEARIGHVGPGARSGDEPMSHPGEEICHVLQGAMHYEIDATPYDLAPGDTIHFRSIVPHRWQSAAKGETRVLWVFSDGLSF